MATDWKQFAGHEMSLDEVIAMGKERPKFWGWADGMFLAGADDMIALRLHNGHTYEPVTRALWRAICMDAQMAVDVGTHSGIFTLDAWRAGAKNVVSVEPHPINYSRLVLNLRRNDFSCNGVFYGAAGDRNHVGNLTVKGNMIFCYAAGRMNTASDNAQMVPTRVMRLDTLIPEAMHKDVRAVKIDAENWTPNVLTGMGKILESTPDLIIECIAPGMEKILAPYGYKFWRIWESGTIEEIDNLEPHNPNNNYNGTHEECRNRFASVRGLP